jgi:hypothetical protein
VEDVSQTAFLTFARPSDHRRCPEHEADGKHPKRDDDEGMHTFCYNLSKK